MERRANRKNGCGTLVSGGCPGPEPYAASFVPITWPSLGRTGGRKGLFASNTPENAYKCFMYTDLDVLVLENFILLKNEQRNIEGKEDYQKQFKLD